MQSLLKFLFLFGVRGIFVFCVLGFGYCPQDEIQQQSHWPARYSATFGFEIMVDPNGLIILSSVDTTSQAYKLGVRPGMEILGWNTLPIKRKLEAMKIGKYRKIFPMMTDHKIKLMLLTRGRNGETAEVFFMTSTRNNWGIRLTAK